MDISIVYKASGSLVSLTEQMAEAVHIIKCFLGQKKNNFGKIANQYLWQAIFQQIFRY